MTEARLNIELEEKHEEEGASPKKLNRLQRLAIGLVITSALLAGGLKLLFRRRKP